MLNRFPTAFDAIRSPCVESVVLLVSATVRLILNSMYLIAPCLPPLVFASVLDPVQEGLPPSLRLFCSSLYERMAMNPRLGRLSLGAFEIRCHKERKARADVDIQRC